jgi:hypothetical protein
MHPTLKIIVRLANPLKIFFQSGCAHYLVEELTCHMQGLAGMQVPSSGLEIFGSTLYLPEKK